MSLSENILKYINQITHYHVQDSVDKAFLFALLGLFPVRRASVINLFYADKVKLVETYLIEENVSEKDNPTFSKTNKMVFHNEYLDNCLDQRKPCVRCQMDSQQVYFPILINDKPTRILHMVVHESFDDETYELLKYFVGAYKNHASLIHENEHDTLTGLLNRKTFDDKLNNVLHNHIENIYDPDFPDRSDNRCSSLATDEPRYWLGLIDIDYFKKINDVYGHLYGDEVLLMISQLMQKSFRINDMLFRYGGEEFIIILDQTSEEMAYRIFERFRKNVEEHHFPQVGNVTISIGISHVCADCLPRTIVDMADQALYYAKDHGRNRSCNYRQLLADGEIKAAASNDDNVELF